jgi:hypothetical protein
MGLNLVPKPPAIITARIERYPLKKNTGLDKGGFY